MASLTNVLGLKEVTTGKQSKRLPTTSLVDESCVYGREGDREEIIKLLLSDDAKSKDVGVITIVGMGGVGKTTLAQLAYNDCRVKEQFVLRAWACISQEFDIVKITKTILESITMLNFETEDLNQLQVSKLIITTRNANAASAIRTVPSYYLQPLSFEDCWLLFAKHAFEDEVHGAHPNLEVIGKAIVKKSKGIPLAAKTLAGLLHGKLSTGEWENVLYSEIWDLPTKSCEILPVLRLSYHYLPVHLKRCFAYCSIFPKGYIFEKEKLVLLWMAEGLLQQPGGNKLMEEVGDEYFRDLVSSEDAICYISDKVPNELLPTLTYLRVLSLSHYKITSLSESISNLIYLRYLDLSHSNQKTSESVTNLYNLQTLLLSFCYLTELPENLWKLINLRHLDIRGSRLSKMPLYMGQMKELQRLTNFVVGESGGSRIRELRELSNLRGALSISKLQYVVHANDAQLANFKDKPHLDELMLEWDNNNDHPNNDMDVLESCNLIDT
ncbi:hypothetical protein GH714_010951 [Hevea brasiliensis]|uniref:NB-ARC domain-containing protein n=1 Tax=Hevea brasiliensis TaxID=3981 RepID=A0A6A6N3U1_HEVBR|nr:hypothetical protein GH714_010951 [Hevea brasiliensis]